MTISETKLTANRHSSRPKVFSFFPTAHFLKTILTPPTLHTFAGCPTHKPTKISQQKSAILPSPYFIIENGNGTVQNNTFEMMNIYENDISLEDLAAEENLSARTVNICKDAGLTSLKRILDFSNKGNKFKFIRKCGFKTEKELVGLCKKYQDWKPVVETIDNTDLYAKTSQNNTFEILNISEEDISLEDLTSKEDLSVRSISICENADLTSLKRILDFYEKRKTFLSIRNCGAKTEIELVKLCKKYQGRKPTIERADLNNILFKINAFTPIQKATLNRHLEYLISNLTVRAYNALHNVSETLSPKEIFDRIFIDRFDFKVFINIGNKSAGELDKFKNDIYNFAEMLQTIKNEQLSTEYAKLLIKTNFTDLSQNFEEQIESVFDENGKIKLFALLKKIIDFGQFFSKIEKRLFAFIYTNENNSGKSIDLLAKEFNLPKHQISRIKAKLEENIQRNFLFITNLVSEDLVNYGIENSKSLQIIDNSFAEKINEKEEVNFNSFFYSIILGIFLKKTHSVLGDDEIMYGIKRTTRIRKYLNCYLIKLLLFDSFDFEKFIEDVYKKISDRIEETYSLHFEGYLCEFIKENGLKYLNEIKSICEPIIFTEFDLVVNFDGYIVFERSIKKPLYEYAIEILEKNGIVMKVDDIAKAINEMYPELETTEQSIRQTVQKEKDIFIHFGRTSTYGLKKWEQERENIKGGTIRNIVEEFLTLSNSPKHISEILSYVQKYRQTNERSVMTNIIMEENNRFKFFDGDFVGLKSSTYGLETLKFKRVIGSHFINKFLAKLTGLDFEKVIDWYVNKYGYAPVQVRSVLQKKIAEGSIQLTIDNKIKYE